MNNGARRVAVLIDADNASAAHAASIFEEVATHGEANVRRIYGDFSGTRLRAWCAQMQPLAILPQQQFNYTTGKNAADIALVIDAMDLMHTGAIDTFCLVSSDSDFTRLALALRERGKTVIGFGKRTTPVPFIKACNRFIYLENLGPAVSEAEANGAPGLTGAEPPSASTAVESEAAAGSGPAGTRPKKDPPSKAAPLIRRAMADLENDEGWVTLSAIGSRLQNLAPDFDARSYGQDKLSEVVSKSGAFDLEKTDSGHLRARRRRPAHRKE